LWELVKKKRVKTFFSFLILNKYKMGGGNSEEIEEQEQVPVIPELKEGEEGKSVVDVDVKNPENALESKLYESSKFICQWQDASEYSFRLRQVELLNFAIRVIARKLSQATEPEEYKELHGESMVYMNAFNRKDEDGEHKWEILSKDPLFVPADREETFFAIYEQYMGENSGKTSEEYKSRFEQFLRQFIRLRDRLIQYLGKNCVKEEREKKVEE
jgi:hypothetical protein